MPGARASSGWLASWCRASSVSCAWRSPAHARRSAKASAGWDEERQVGVALHMVSAVAVAGRLGATAIGDSPEHAQELYDDVVRCLDAAAGAD